MVVTPVLAGQDCSAPSSYQPYVPFCAVNPTTHLPPQHHYYRIKGTPAKPVKSPLVFRDLDANPTGADMECLEVDEHAELMPSSSTDCALCSAVPGDTTYCDTSNAKDKCHGKCCTKTGHAWCPTSSCIANGLGDLEINCGPNAKPKDDNSQGSARCPLPDSAICQKFDAASGSQPGCDSTPSAPNPHCE